MAAKKVPIESLEVEKLASYGLTNKELAEFFHCSTDTLERRFKQQLAKGRNNLRMRLRVKQIQVAMKGNPAMLIFLGKQYLQQTDRNEIGGKVDMNYTSEAKSLDAKEFAKAFGMVAAVAGGGGDGVESEARKG